MVRADVRRSFEPEACGLRQHLSLEGNARDGAVESAEAVGGNDDAPPVSQIVILADLAPVVVRQLRDCRVAERLNLGHVRYHSRDSARSGLPESRPLLPKRTVARHCDRIPGTAARQPRVQRPPRAHDPGGAGDCRRITEKPRQLARAPGSQPCAPCSSPCFFLRRPLLPRRRRRRRLN